MRMKLKKGDKIQVIAGKSRGKSGVITRVMPAKDMVLVEGINTVKRHRRATAQNRSGQIIDKTMPLHVSNVMIIDPKTGKPSRIKIRRTAEGGRERVSLKSGSILA